MESNEQLIKSLYTQEVLEFAAVGVKFAGLMEQASTFEKRQFVHETVLILPQLYLSTLRLPDYLYSPEQDYIEEFVTEETYETVRLRLAELLGERYPSSIICLRVYGRCLSADSKPARDTA